MEEVSVVYYRSGYMPHEYDGPSSSGKGLEWAARGRAERSRAIKCPTVAYQLVGMKKVQQVLAGPGMLERFTADGAVFRRCFAGLWSLDPGDRQPGSAAAAAAEDAKAHPERYVMKPQREGGGNNVYGEAIREALEAAATDPAKDAALAAYILMERVFPLTFTGYFVRQGALSAVQAVSELGIYGTFLALAQKPVAGTPSADWVVVNKAGGHLLRSKAASADEGGVAAGYAFLDCPVFQNVAQN
jgi:glutathione synthase